MSFERDLLAILPRLRRFAASLSHDRADGDDLCQAALEKGLRARDQWQPGTRLDSWMYRIMRNLWIDEGRARQRAARTFAPEEAGADVGYAGDKAVEQAMTLSDVDRAMQALPPEQREAIALVLVEGLSYKEAAAILNIPMGTLTSRLVRGRGALIELLGEAA
ncbi:MULTISPECIES: RNA polymerase sigma factor [Sphingobium]|jgi:RNA polymerase sigma factor (sigma-70 family)|uniref:Sigma-70 family RNA polymerase sigma factor n=3 Tax=Sphingobium TaxID=165695 RepID=K9CPX4_SPHYA|nr:MULTISPECIES: RNA polymerase sigma factor [Sphingobium]ATI79524.1 RNA polymerase sigma factor [Sphingobium yanoikuyae]AYO77673.1 RNA polymerase sigma factor [Sphingobium yanoikuyae]EKU72931.1 sigma-70 family RNA polymerase sigma factor [Sphingobium yanoikuyae ATCC 51230]KFD28593.1 RNA polymerase sigma70 [Sphingobium yanoikuyae]KZC81840.1 RNA polymerase subunit sigma-70 [Sphingobium yanoikuyae]